MSMELAQKEVAQLISGVAEPSLHEANLLMRPIPFFERFDRFRAREEELKQDFERHLEKFGITVAHRILRSYAFADELSRDVLRNFNPSLSEDGESALRTLWGVAVAIDQLLDEEGVDPASLTPLREWVANQKWDDSFPDNGRLHALISMLEDIFANCRKREANTPAYAAFNVDLIRMLDAELASPGVTLDKPPSEKVRTIVRDKSALLAWVGFQACSLGQQLDPSEARDYQQICDAVGEIFWIMDDLMDLGEDLDREIWNRALWRLYDNVGHVRFGELNASKARMAEAIINQRIITQEIDEISKRVTFLENHPRVKDPVKLKTMMSFWVTSWTGIYS